MQSQLEPKRVLECDFMQHLNVAVSILYKGGGHDHSGPTCGTAGWAIMVTAYAVFGTSCCLHEHQYVSLFFYRTHCKIIECLHTDTFSAEVRIATNASFGPTCNQAVTLWLLK